MITCKIHYLLSNNSILQWVLNLYVKLKEFIKKLSNQKLTLITVLTNSMILKSISIKKIINKNTQKTILISTIHNKINKNHILQAGSLKMINFLSIKQIILSIKQITLKNCHKINHLITHPHPQAHININFHQNNL